MNGKSKPIPPFRREQDAKREYRPQGVYTDVHDQGGTERDKVLRSVWTERIRYKKKNPTAGYTAVGFSVCF